MHYRALSRIVEDPEGFAAKPPEEPRAWRAPDRSLVELVTLADLDGLVGGGLPAPGQIEAHRDGFRVPASRFTWGANGEYDGMEQLARPYAVTRLIEDGAGLYLNFLHRNVRSVNDLTRRLAFESGHRVSAAAFLTPPGTSTFPYHYDVQSVLLLQTVGSKTWALQRPLLEKPLEHESFQDVIGEAEQRGIVDRAPDLTVTLNAGDVLWIPRGWLHHGITTDEPSLHVTIAFHPFTKYWLAQEMVRSLDGPESLSLRDELPWGALRDPAVLGTVVEEVLSTLSSVLPGVDRGRAVRSAGGAAREVYLEPAREESVSSALAAPVGLDTPVVAVAEAISGIDPAPDGKVRVDLRDAGLLVGGRAADFVRSLWEEDSDRAWCAREICGDLAEDGESGGDTEQRAVALVGRLLRAGVVRRARD